MEENIRLLINLLILLQSIHNSGDTIDNGSTTSITLLTQYSKIKLTSDGTTIWFSSV